MNPSEWLARKAKSSPNLPALFRGKELIASYGEFARRAAAIGANLQHLYAIGRGDRVAIVMKNSTQYLEVLYGIWWIGAAAVPINAKLHPKEIAWILENAGTKAVFTSSADKNELNSVTPKCVKKIIVADNEAFCDYYDFAPLPLPVSMPADQMIWLFYTSGTTGKPKGVMISSANIQAMILGYQTDIAVHSPDDASLYAAPMSHGAGIYNFLHVIGGSRHFVPQSDGFNETEILELASRIENVTMFCAPTMVKRLVDCAKSTNRTGKGIKTIIYGGGPMYFSDIIEAVKVMGPRFVQIYGQGECPMAISVLRREIVADRTDKRWKQRLNSVGIAQSATLVRVVDGEFNDIPAGEIGEIIVQSTAVMSGYWQNPEATKDTIHDEWLKTGDLGSLDKEGYISLHDRSKDMIISGGSNIYPREVEEILLLHPLVGEVSVVGRPDKEWGEIAVACIVSPNGEKPDVSELDRLCIENIARFKRPKEYLLLDALPKNNYGKVVKRQLRKLLANASAKTI